MRKVLFFILFSLLLSLASLSAQDPAEQWWVDKPIFSIKFEGLNHVEKSELRGITQKYLGQRYTNELFSEIQGEFFNLQYFAYFSAQAEKGGASGEDLVIIFDFVELPVIKELTFTGNSAVRDADIKEILTVGIGSFATSSKIKETETAIRKLYLSKGFTGVEVVSNLETSTDTNTIQVTITIQEGVQSKISEILFEGNDHFSANTLRRIVVSRQQSLFNTGNFIDDKIQEDRQKLQNYYKERGYIDIQVVNVRIEEVEQEDSSKKMLKITFILDEGDEWRYGGMEITGNEIITDEQILSVITHDIGSPLNAVKIQESISAVAKLYWNDGYVASRIETKELRDEENQSISFSLTINEGNQSTVEDVIITGYEKTKDFVLYRELTVSPGDIFSIDSLLESMRNIYNTGIIDDVTYEILYGTEEDSVIIELSVVESNKIDLEFGATFGGTDDFPISGFLSWTDKNFMGNGQDFSISLNISPSAQTLDFSFEETWLMNRRWSGGITLSAGHYLQTNILQDYAGIIFTKEDYMNGEAAPDPYNSYETYQAALAEGLSVSPEYMMEYDQYLFSLGLSTGYSFHTSLGRLNVSGMGNVSLSRVAYDATLYRPYNPIIRYNLEHWRFTNKAGLNFSWDGRDLIENTTTGFLFQQGISYAGGILGGVSNYIKSTTRLSGYATLFEVAREDKKAIKGVLSLKSSLSMMLPQFYNNDGTWEWGLGATQSEKLYIDGMNVARGKTPVYNLDYIWDNVIEFSMPISENLLWGEIYTSATGYVSDLSDVPSMSIDNYYFSTGAGIRLAIPGFPLGLYLTKNFYFEDSTFHWEGGDILANADNEESGLKLVLAITTSLY